MLTLQMEVKGLDDLLKKVDPEAFRKTARRTLSRTASSCKTLISSQIREMFLIKKADLDKKITVDLSGLKNFQAKVKLTGEPVSLIYFGPQQVRGTLQTGISKNRGVFQKKSKRASKFSGVKVKIVKSKETRLNAFIAAGRGGTPLVFRRIPGTQSPNAPVSKRTGRPWKREKLRAIKVMSYPSMLRKPERLKAIEDKCIEQMKKEFANNIKFYGQEG